MIILDTNVLSEVIRATPDSRVLEWLENQERADVYTTAISLAEMLSGAVTLPAGKRRDSLERLIRALFDTQFGTGLLPFDTAAAGQFAWVVGARRQLGRPIGGMDAQIAAIARTKAASLATRDIADFSGLGIELVNPWDA